METLVFEMSNSWRCQRCNFLTPLPGLREKIACASCASLGNFKKIVADNCQGGITYMFGGYYDVVAESLADPPNETEFSNDSHGFPMMLRRKPLACRCGAALQIPPPGATTVACATCHAKTPVRWADAGTREWDPRIACVVGDSGETVAHAKPPKLDGTVVGCGTCGGPLPLRGHERTLPCGHCSADNFLDDDLWLRLFPLPEDHLFYLVYVRDAALVESVAKYVAGEQHGLDEDYEARLVAHIDAHRLERALRDTRGAIELAQARGFVANVTLTPDQIARLDAALTPALRMQLIEGAVSGPMLARWGASPQASSLALAAARPGTHTETDPDDGVRLAIAQHWPLSAEAAGMLACDPRADVRLAIAKRDDTPGPVLAKLRKDRDAGVEAAARANASYTPGLFGKLFGG